jgi:hypothetical protein
MKYISLLLLFFSFAGFSQTIEIYNYDKNGIREISPTKIIETNKEQINIYNVDKNGIKEIVPIQIIRDNNVYNVQNAVPQFPAIQRIEATPLPTTVEPLILPTLNIPVIFNF